MIPCRVPVTEALAVIDRGEPAPVPVTVIVEAPVSTLKVVGWAPLAAPSVAANSVTVPLTQRTRRTDQKTLIQVWQTVSQQEYDPQAGSVWEQQL